MRTQITIETSIRERLKQCAAETGMTLQGLATQVLSAWLAGTSFSCPERVLQITTVAEHTAGESGS